MTDKLYAVSVRVTCVRTAYVVASSKKEARERARSGYWVESSDAEPDIRYTPLSVAEDGTPSADHLRDPASSMSR